MYSQSHRPTQFSIAITDDQIDPLLFTILLTPRITRPITTTIEQGDVLTHIIAPTKITNECVNIKLRLLDAVEKTTSFYIYQTGQEAGDVLVKYSVKRGREDERDLDLDEVDDDTFEIALYAKEHATQSISNKLEINLPGTGLETSETSEIHFAAHFRYFRRGRRL